jgi:hypothetical protein
MAKGNNRTLLLAGLAAGAYAYFSKQENREKAMVAFTNTKTKVNSFLESQKLNKMDMNREGHSEPDNNKKVNEGTMTSVQYDNNDVQDDQKKSTVGKVAE